VDELIVLFTGEELLLQRTVAKTSDRRNICRRWLCA